MSKNLYKSLDDSNVSLEDVATGQNKTEEYRIISTPATPHQFPSLTPTPVASSMPLSAHKNAKVIPVQKNTADKKDDDSDVTILVGSASRGIYLSKKKVGLLSKSNPRLFALKLFELVYRFEEAKGVLRVKERNFTS